MRIGVTDKILRGLGFIITQFGFLTLFHSNTIEYMPSNLHCGAIKTRQMYSACEEPRRVIYVH